MMENIKTSIEERIFLGSTITEALEGMRDYKNWSETTFICYQNDVIQFEEFLSDCNLDPNLENCKLHHIQRWIKSLRDNGVASSTIKRRIASLSSIFSFYRNLGIVNQNCFKAVDIPLGKTEHHSRILEWEELRKVYRYADELRNTQSSESHVSTTIRMLMFTGLRNETLTDLRVEHVDFEKSLLRVTHSFKKINTKHKVQIIPLPPKLLKEIEQHVSNHQLHPRDKLLFGLAGQALGDKALNRLTNRICHDLGWKNDQRVTPHGFRATISTILSERGLELAAIKFLLGHSEQDNLQFYIRRYGRHIRLLQKELTRIEDELSHQPEEANQVQNLDRSFEAELGNTVDTTHFLSRDMLLNLLNTDPELAVILIQKGLVQG
ncbi:tyrosine-type recombinase/integrase [Brevibacillus sp. DP1.3A]|uniref:tyrosine-type recombinase/integrase n=1 Tax=Brevibacillus sp. DP1.3A TaxID=2738867 RepID=UPI00156B7523|nr:tyrosine-type recombinase/integrase [Brevibacillus sp. DP1.3A]UED72182.1 site-specific integrase [Brevibacillus sp. DP1.3A]